MPSRNSKKIYDINAYYHVYNRGTDKRVIFRDEADYEMFINLLRRYVGNEVARDRSGREYDWYGDVLQVAAFCLMPNHFHILIYQTDAAAMTAVLRAVCGSYTVYFNKRYNRSGTLFQGVYRASHITTESYLLHITRYIHRNPDRALEYRWSSIANYIGGGGYSWVNSELLVDDSAQAHKQYREFMISSTEKPDDFKSILANS